MVGALFWAGGSRWENVLGGWEWLGVYGHYFGWVGLVGKYFGWVGVSGVGGALFCVSGDWWG